MRRVRSIARQLKRTLRWLRRWGAVPEFAIMMPNDMQEAMFGNLINSGTMSTAASPSRRAMNDNTGFKRHRAIGLYPRIVDEYAVQLFSDRCEFGHTLLPLNLTPELERPFQSSWGR